VGLERECAGCHEDVHRGALDRDCTTCHNLEKWKPAPRFEHAKTDYPLTGKHAALACAKCHQAPALATAHDEQGRPLPQWKPLPHADCTPCHADPHAGRFAGACAKCHRTESFTAIDPRGFDHDRTRYPLLGRHATVACEKCHDEKTAWGRKPPFATCGGCHRDAHAGQATLAGRAADCAACHRVEGFDRPVYTVAQHQTSAYPLEGRHAAAACDRCHARQAPGTEARFGAARVALRPAHGACPDCHRDPHAGRFVAGGARPRAAGCRACHSMQAFRPSAMDVALHAATPFPLEGAHRALPCVACHAELKAAPAASSLASAGADARPLRFAESRAACTDCHADVHAGQFAARPDHGACGGCHSTDRFAPADRFDHARDTAFRLEGAHARAACASCHRAERRGRATVVAYHGVPTRCESCHTTVKAPPRRSSLDPGRTPSLAADPLATREVRHVPTRH
jgi:hypothetical protein